MELFRMGFQFLTFQISAHCEISLTIKLKYHQSNYAGQMFKLFQRTLAGSINREGCYIYSEKDP